MENCGDSPEQKICLPHNINTKCVYCIAKSVYCIVQNVFALIIQNTKCVCPIIQNVLKMCYPRIKNKKCVHSMIQNVVAP